MIDEVEFKPKNFKSVKFSFWVFYSMMLICSLSAYFKMRIMCMQGAQGVPAIGFAFVDIIVLFVSYLFWSLREFTNKQFLLIVVVIAASLYVFISRVFC